MRRRLLAGEWLRSDELTAEYGTSRSLLGVILRGLREQGYQTKAKKVGGNQQAVRLVLRKAPEAEAEPVLPQLGMQVTVTLLAMDDDGQVVLGLRNGSVSWMCRLS